jgi:3-dehydroshikimate dehydratase
MIRLGLCSGACITLDTGGVIAIASAAGLDAIEWSADTHIGVDDLKAAESVMMATLMAGLTVASLATLYRAGSEDRDFARFDALLGMASAIQAPIMRIFVYGNGSPKGSAAPDGSWAEAASVLQRLGDRAADKGITLCLSMGRGTALDTYGRAARLVAAVKHDFVRLALEDLPGSSAREATAAFEGAGRLAGLVVARCTGRDGMPRALDAGEWRERIGAYKKAEADPKMGSFLLLGAARPEGEVGAESLAADVLALRSLISDLEPRKD